MQNQDTPHTNENDNVVTRFPPSPTGPLHVGGARTALFSWLFAHQHDGRMTLRFEDTDTERSKQEYVDDIKESMDWLNLDYDGPYKQSDRTNIYRSYLEQLLADGYAYRSDESDTDDGQDEVIRFDNPGKEVSFTDMIRGEITMDTSDLGDFVIAKSITEPLYHLAVVVDDYEMNVSHVIRGDEHIANTPRQLLLINAIGAERPNYAHLPLIHGQDGKKLSKRHGATSVMDFKNKGYLPQAMINYLALVGWHPQDDQEIFTREGLLDTFDLTRVQKSPAVFSYEKLQWVNREHIKRLSEESFYDHVREYIPEDIRAREQFSKPRLRSALPAIRERTETLTDITEMAEAGELSFFFSRPDYSADDLIWDDESAEDTAKYLKEVISKWSEIDKEEFTEDAVKSAVWDYSSEVGRGSVLWPTRFALSGQEQSPGPFVIAEIVGKEEAITRLEQAVEKLANA
jgi:glutamyl-tRNA synthetase